MNRFEIVRVYKRFFWPHPYAAQAKKLWVKLVVGYEHYVDGQRVWP
tara:strand:- start:175 stop:312 length:138 start_codon:yes stop_codon:yes gene_type:complete